MLSESLLIWSSICVPNHIGFAAEYTEAYDWLPPRDASRREGGLRVAKRKAKSEITRSLSRTGGFFPKHNQALNKPCIMEFGLRYSFKPGFSRNTRFTIREFRGQKIYEIGCNQVSALNHLQIGCAAS